MYKVGEYQNLEVMREFDFGYFLNFQSGDDQNDILLPKSDLFETLEIGETLKVFVYLDAKDRLTATTKEPLCAVGELSYLKVADKVEFGAFLEIGLQRDLFMPLIEIKYDLEIGSKYLVYVYLDKSGRMCATTKIYDHLTINHEYKANDRVNGTIYFDNPEIGVFVAVDNKFKGLIPKNECFDKLEPGQIVDLRVIRVREDGKLDLATRKLVADQMSVDAEKIYSKLLNQGGVLKFNDKSSPESIKEEFSMSKKAFKRALGRLFKEKRIELHEDRIEKVEK